MFVLRKLIDSRTSDPCLTELPILCKWALLVEVASALMEHHRIGKYIPLSKLWKIRRFLKAYSPNINEHFLSKGKETIKETTDRASGTYELDVSVAKLSYKGESGGSTKRVTEQHVKRGYYDYIQQFEKLLMDTLLSSKSEITLIIDDLDEKERITDDHDTFLHFVKGVTDATRGFNRKLSTKRNGNSKIIILLRDDIVNFLHRKFTNTNKHFSSAVVELNWYKQRHVEPHEHPLLELVFYKLRSRIEKFTSLTDKELYDLLFPEAVYNMSAINHILNHSLGRPRDVIQYLNCVKANFPDSTSFHAKALRDSRKDYSKYFYKEIMNEIATYENVEELNELVNLLEAKRKWVLSYQEIEAFLFLNKSDYPAIKDLRSAVTALYRIGVLGNTWSVKGSDTRELINRYSWYHHPDGKDKADFTKKFMVHQGLWRRLG